MFGSVILALMAPGFGDRSVVFESNRQGPMQAQNIYLLPGGPQFKDPIPDLAVMDLRILGDTLYVQVKNEGGRARVAALVSARAEVNGVRTELATVRTTQLKGGETRWVPVRGFSFKTAANSPTVLALENASSVSATARLVPSTAGSMDRTGNGCGDCSTDANESNNELTLGGQAIKRGKPE
jgi:hypothetical protein